MAPNCYAKLLCVHRDRMVGDDCSEEVTSDVSLRKHCW